MVVCVGGGLGWRWLVEVSAWCVCGLVSGGGARGDGFGAALLVVGGGQGWVLCRTGVWASRRVVCVLRVRAVRFLRTLAGCSVEVRVGGGCLSIRLGLWSVCSGWLLVDGACWHGVQMGGLLVVEGCSL